MHGSSYSLMSSTFYVTVKAPPGGSILQCIQYKKTQLVPQRPTELGAGVFLAFDLFHIFVMLALEVVP